MEDSNYINFGDICRNRMGQQCQYGSRYFSKTQDYPYLGDGLRIIGTCADYHSMKIHKDDVEIAVKRYQANRQEQN